MKKILTKMLSVTLVLVMMMCLVPPVEAEASSKKPSFPTKIDEMYYPKDKQMNTAGWIFGNEGTNYKITNLKSSNKKVLTVSKKYQYKYTTLNMKLKKAGTATISFKVKIGSKTYNYKCKVTVSAYTNPVKTLKIGSKNYASKFKNSSFYDLGGKKNHKGKLSITANKNWKIESIYIYNLKTGKEQKVKNNKSITLKKNHTLGVSLRNKKTGKWSYVSLSNYNW